MNDTTDVLLYLIGCIYDASTEPDRWPLFLQALADALGAAAASFVAADAAHAASWLQVTVRVDPEATVAYNEHFGALDPWGIEGRRRQLFQSGVVLPAQAVCPHALFRKTEFFNEFGRHFGIVHGLAAVIEGEQRLASIVSLYRPSGLGEFEARDVTLLRLLVPHLQRALQIRRRIAPAEAFATGAQGILERLCHGAILLNRQGRIVFTNHAADEMLRSRDGLLSEGHQLRAALPSENVGLRTCVADAIGTSNKSGIGAGGVLALQRPSGRRALRLVISPCGPSRSILGIEPAAVFVLISDPERTPLPSESQLQRLLGLTRSETRLALLLSEGLSLQQAAERLELRVGTVRTRLKNIFAKTHTHRQAELIRLILNAGLSPLA